MEKTTNQSIAAYKQQLASGELQTTYQFLIKYVMKIKYAFEKAYGNKYSYSNVAPGYMDYTYFPFADSFMRQNKLRYGIVLNHKKMCFELWLMGRNATVQKDSWQRLKTSPWNQDQPTMPQYSVLETTIIENPNFDRPDELTKEITEYVKSVL